MGEAPDDEGNRCEPVTGPAHTDLQFPGLYAYLPGVFHRKPLMRVVKSIGIAWLLFMALLLLLYRYAIHAYFMMHQYGAVIYFRLNSAFGWSGILALLHFFWHFSS